MDIAPIQPGKRMASDLEISMLKILEKDSVENKKLKDKVGVDPLTGLLDRRGFYERIEQVLGRGRDIGVVMFDLDEFKGINDRYGHFAGDAVLIDTAKILKDMTRNVDLVIRWGGEEFLIVMPDDKDAKVLAERLKKEFENNNVRYNNLIIKRSASFGVTNGHDSYDNIDNYINLADAAMYKAKQNGRNQVAVSK